ncbi:MAG: hypothetical protein U1E50_03725 [Caulobacteraceae bacterium]
MFSRRQTILAAAALLAPEAARAAVLTEDLRRTLLSAARRAVPSTAEMRHPVLILDLGRLGFAGIALFADEDQSTYSGLTAMGRGGRIDPLPEVYELDGRFEMTVEAVLTVPDAAGSKAIVVLYSYYINGTGQPEGHAGYLYRWGGDEWLIDEVATRKLAGVRNAAQARVRLR